MAKNQVEFSLVGKLDANDIMSGIQKIKNDLSKEKLGDKLFESSSKGLQDIENRLKKVMSNIPGSGSTPKQMAAFEHSIKDVATELSQWEGKLKGFELTDKYLASNIQSIKDLLKVFDEYSEKVQSMQDKMGTFSVERVKGSQILGRIDKTAPKMIAAAQAGDYEGLRSGQQYLLGELKNKLVGGDISQDIFDKQAAAINKFAQQLRGCISIMNEYKKQADAANTDVKKGFEESRQAAEQNRGTVVNSANEQIEKLIGIGDAARQGSQGLQELSEREKSIQNLTNRIKYLFSATSVFSVLRRVVRGAVKDFQELDKEFNEIAIVSRYSTAEMWQSFSQVNQMAQEYGVTTKNILEVQNLYYHQGKDMAEVNKLTAQTLTLAKITGMDYADATNKLTAALNAYKLTAEDAVRVTDTVAALSANAATSSEELMTALTKTASIAANAGVSLENTEVFLTKMIETTREAPENLGTALKTIVARFGEVKNAIDENGEAIEQADINKVDKALKTVGITLLDTAGQMRDLDDVFMELSSKWDGLDRNTQRYLATMAAGSRQQSRFIAMMENYDRTLELVDVAQNSAGTGARQLAKAQESIETSLNRLRSAWQEFYSGIITSGAIKWFIELGNSIVGIFNKVNKIPAIGPYISLIVGSFGLWAAKTFIVDKALTKLGGTIATGIGIQKQENTELIKQNSLLDQINIKKRLLAQTRLQEQNIQKIQNILLLTEGQEMSALSKEQQEYLAAKILNIATTSKSNEEEKEAITTYLMKKLSIDKDSASIMANTIVTNINTESVENNKRAQTGLIGVIKNKWTNLGTSFTKIATNMGMSAGKLGIVLGAIVIVIGAIVAATIILHNKWREDYEIISDTSEQLDELNKRYEEYNKQIQNTKTLNENIKVLEKYKDTLLLTTEQEEEYQQAITNIAENYPTLIDYIDEEGNYHLKTTEILKEELEVQKELNKEKRKNYLKYSSQLAQEGIFSEDSNIPQKISNILKMRSSELEISSQTAEEQAKELLKQAGYSWYDIESRQGDGQLRFSGVYSDLRDSIQKWITGENTSGISREFLNSALYAQGSSRQFSKKQYQQFIQAMSGLDFSSENIKKALENLDFSTSDIENIDFSLRSFNNAFGGILDAMSSQAKEIFSQKKQELLLSLDDIDFKFSTSAETNAHFAEAVAEALPNVTDEEFANYMQKLTEEEYNKIGELFSAGELKLGDLGIESFDKINFDEILKKIIPEISKDDPFYDAYKKILENIFTLTDSEIADIKTVILTQDTDLADYTKTQLEAMLKTAGALTDAYGSQGAAKQAYKNILKILGDNTKAVNTLNSADLKTAEGVSQFAKEMTKLGVDTKSTTDIIKLYTNGIENVPLMETGELISTLKKNTEDFNDQLEALGRLKEGKGTIEDLNSALNILTSGLQGVELLNTIEQVKNSMKATGEGLLMDMSVIGMAGNSLLQQQVSGDQVLINLYEIVKQKSFEAAQAAALEAAKANSAAQAAIGAATSMVELRKAVSGLSNLGLDDNAKWNDAINRYTQADISSWMISNFKAMSKASTDALNKSEDAAKKAADAAKRMQEAWQNFVDYLNNVDRYSNLDALLDRIKDKIDNLEFEISFSTNPKEIAKDLKSQLNEIQRQMAGNIAGKRGAERNLLARRNAISSNSQTKGYLSFGTDGNIIINQQKMLALEERIRDAKIKNDEVTLAVLEGQEKAIEDNVKAYNDELKAVQRYTKGVQEGLTKTQDIYKNLYEQAKALDDKLIEVIQQREDKELELTKKKYDAIKEEDNKYLDSVRKMIDKERALREQKNDEDAVRDKERKLAMMKMDTSGIYSSEIRALEKELKQDYQDLSDKAVDRMVDQLEEENNARAESMDKDVYYTETALERKRELMTDYYDTIKQMDAEAMMQLMQQGEEYVQASATQKEALKQQYLDLIGQGQGAKETLSDGSIASVQDALEKAQESATDLDNAIKLYGDNAKVTNGEVQTSVSSLAGEYSSLVSIIAGNGDSLVSAYNSLRDAIEKCAKKTKELNAEQAKTKLDNSGGESTGDNTGETGTPITLAPRTMMFRRKGGGYTPTKESDAKQSITVYYRGNTSDWTINDTIYNMAKVYDENGVEYWVYGNEVGLEKYKKKRAQTKEDRIMASKGVYKYASGGLVDYTGPAWVDGTKANPEAFLSAADTANIAKLRDVLSIAFDPTTPTYPNSQSTSNATYNITIEVDSIASDYDVDQAVSHLQSKIQQASGYRNINILKKSK